MDEEKKENQCSLFVAVVGFLEGRRSPNRLLMRLHFSKSKNNSKTVFEEKLYEKD